MHTHVYSYPLSYLTLHPLHPYSTLICRWPPAHSEGGDRDPVPRGTHKVPVRH